MSTLIQSIAGIQAALRRNKKETGDPQRVVDAQKAPEKRLQALEAEQRVLEEALAAAEAEEQQARARLVDCDYWITRLEPYEAVFTGTAPGLSMLADDAMAGRLPGLDPYRFAGGRRRVVKGLTCTTRPERNAFKALKLAAPFMRWKHSPPTTDEAQAVAYAVLALTLAPYVDGLDAPALGDARDGGAGAYGGGGNSDSRFYDRTFVYSPTNHYATAPSDRMDYMTARALAGSKLLREGRRGSHGAPTAPLQNHYRSRLSNFIRLLSWWRSSPGWRGVGNPLPPRVD